MLTTAYQSQFDSKEDKLYAQSPQVVFASLFQKELKLFPDLAFKPIRVQLRLLQGTKLPAVLAVEMSLPPFDYAHLGREISIRNFDKCQPSHFHKAGTSYSEHGYAVGNWVSSGFTLSGNSTLISSNKIALNALGANTEFSILSSSGILKNPIFRIRRSYDTTVASEVIGTGDGTKVVFPFTLAHTPVCPSSISITFEDAIGVKSTIRDTGYGNFGSIPREFHLMGMENSTIDYLTGNGVLVFSSLNVPKNTKTITCNYEYESTGVIDNSNYRIDWSYEY